MASYSAPGYRFHPTDEELVNHYLRLKMLGNDHLVNCIAELNVYDFEPGQLPKHAAIQSDDLVWYFFCPRIYKYLNSQRANRTTKDGYWKITGKDRKVKTESGQEVIAVKKTLVFYEGRAPGVKTSWVMHEYHPTFNLPNQRNFVICKIKNNADYLSVPEEGESSSQMSSNYTENQSQYQNISVEQDDPEMQALLDYFDGYNEKDYSLNATLPV